MKKPNEIMSCKNCPCIELCMQRDGSTSCKDLLAEWNKSLDLEHRNILGGNTNE